MKKTTHADHETRNIGVKSKHHGLSRSAMVLGMIPHLLLAPSLGIAAETDEGVRDTIEEIVVTARFREERLQDIPDTVKVFSAGDIREARIVSISDVSALVPNFSMFSSQDAGLAAVNIRGIGQVRNGEPPLAVVIDGVQISHPDQIRQPLFDIASIEVLKGPQGALYGRNAIGGALIVNTEKPTDELKAIAEIGYGNGNDKSAQIVSSGPLVQEKLHFRAAGSWREFDGLHDNITTGRKSDHLEEYSLRFRADYHPSENLNLDLRLSRHQTTIGGAFVPVPDGNPNVIIPVQAGINSKSKNRLTDASLKIDYETSIGTLTSVTSWSEVSLDMLQQLGQGIPNPTLGGIQGRGSESISEDVRLQSSADQKLRYVVGAYYLYHKPEISTTILFLDDVFQPVGQLTVAQTENTSDAYAVYGQMNYDLTDDLELTLGLRYDRQEIEQVDLLRDATRTDVSFDSLQPKVSLAYALNPDSLVYATYSEGFRSGGFNAPSPLFPLIYDAESTENVEIGMKTSFMDGGVIFNVAGFYTRDENQALQRLVVATQGITTIEETEFKGVDVDLTVHVGEGLVLTGGVGWIDSEIKDYDGTDTYVGNRAPLSYEYSYNVAAQYSMNFGEFDLVSRFDVSRNQGLYWHVDNEHKQAPVTLVNGRVALEFEKFELALYAKNLFNEKYYQEYCSRVFCGGDFNPSWLGALRQYGLTARYNF